MIVSQLIEALKKANPLATVVVDEDFEDFPREAQVVVQSADAGYVKIFRGRTAKTFEIDWEEERYLFDEVSPPKKSSGLTPEQIELANRFDEEKDALEFRARQLDEQTKAEGEFRLESEDLGNDSYHIFGPDQ